MAKVDPVGPTGPVQVVVAAAEVVQLAAAEVAAPH